MSETGTKQELIQALRWFLDTVDLGGRDTIHRFLCHPKDNCPGEGCRAEPVKHRLETYSHARTILFAVGGR